MAQLRTVLPVAEVARRHAAGESLRSLAAAHGTSIHTLTRHLRRSGFEVRSRHDDMALSNVTRDPGPSKAQGQVTANRKLRHKKTALVRAYREKHGCQVCGVNHPAILDLHHKDPAQKHRALRTMSQSEGYRKGSSGRGWVFMSFPDIASELEKCVVLCANCHRISEWHDRKDAKTTKEST